MNRKIYLSTYLIELRSKRKEERLFFSKYKPDAGAAETDFLDTFYNFIIDLGKEQFEEVQDEKRDIKKTLTISADRKQIRNKTERIVYGFLSSGINGEIFKVHSSKLKKKVFDGTREHTRLLETYYHIYVPENRKYALLVLQRHGGFGIKKLFQAALRDYLVKISHRVSVDVNNVLVSRIFETILKEGRIFEMSFIKNHIPDDIEKLYDVGANKIVGKTKTMVSAKPGLGIPVRGFFFNMFMRPDKDGVVKVEQLNDQYDEVDIEVEYKGSKKTIHMSNVGRSLPDYDVTDSIRFDINDLPTVDSLKEQAEDLLKDIIEIQEKKLKGA